MTYTDNIDKISLLNLFIDKFPDLSKEMIFISEKECSEKIVDYLSFSDEKKMNTVIDYIIERNMIDDSKIALLQLYSLIEFNFQDFYKDFFDLINYLNSEGFFKTDSIKQKSTDLEDIKIIKNKLMIFIEQYGINYPHILKQIYRLKKSLKDIDGFKNKETEELNLKINKYLLKIERLKSELENTYSEQIKNYSNLEQILKEYRLNQLLSTSNIENMKFLEKQYLEFYSDINSFDIDLIKLEKDKIELYFDFIESLELKLRFINKLNAVKRNITYIGGDESLINEISMFIYKLQNIIKEKLNILSAEIKSIPDENLAQVFDEEYIERALEIKKAVDKFYE